MPRGCSDWYGTHAALRGTRGRLVPIPERALDGLAEFERRGGLSRRDLLAGGVGLLLAANGIPGLSTRGVLEAAAAQAAGAPDAADPRLALPRRRQRRAQHARARSADPRYPQLRSRIGIDPATALPLDDDPGFGWHPSLAGLRELYDAGKVAVLPAVDYAHPDQSHFNSGGVLAQRHRRAGARPQRLARAHARRDRVARQSAAGHPRRLGSGPAR